MIVTVQGTSRCGVATGEEPLSVVPKLRVTDPTIWWFGGDPVDGYKGSTQLVATGTPGPYSWSIDAGAAYVEFKDHKSTIQTTTKKVDVFPKRDVVNQGDVHITVTVNGQQSDQITMTVLQPYSLQPRAPVDASDPRYGYLSYVYYDTYDNLGHRMPDIPVPLHEEYTGALVPDYAGTNWRPSVPNSSVLSPIAWYDVIGGEGAVGFVPQPLAPQTPLTKVKVDHQKGAWYVGSQVSGKGILVETMTWQKFQDHARHVNVVSPVVSKE